MIEDNGLLNTYKFVMNKLEAPSPFEYSCSGKVISVSDDVKKIRQNYVACGGQGAYHADVVSQYLQILLLRFENIDMKQAAFSTIASIAIQGIRSGFENGRKLFNYWYGFNGQLTYKMLGLQVCFLLV